MKRITHHVSRLTFHVPRFTHSHWLLLVTAVLLLVVKLTIIDRVETPLRRANLVDGRLRRVDVPMEITFGDEFVLLGYDALPAPGVSSGERFEVVTYWRALLPGGPNYGVTVNVVGPQALSWSGADVRSPRWHRGPPPEWEWPPDQYGVVALSVPLLPGTPPGTYTVEVVAFDRDTLAPLTAHDASGRALGPALPLGQVAVVAPPRPADADALDIRHRFDASLGPLTLLGADFDRDQAAPGDPILLTTFWRAEEQPADDLTVRLELLAPDGALAAAYDLSPAASWYPTSAWHPGDVWRGQHILRLPAMIKSGSEAAPADLDSGDYTWHLTLLPIYQSTSLPSTIRVTAPARIFAPPPVDIETNTRLGDIATLVGANLEPAAQSPSLPIYQSTSITVTLVWRAEAETHTSYHAFLHLLDPQGRLVAQSDGVPADWTRPTTGWLPGEYIADVRLLAIPPDAPAGEYTLSAGLYVPGGERLTAPGGADAIPLTTFQVEAR